MENENPKVNANKETFRIDGMDGWSNSFALSGERTGLATTFSDGLHWFRVAEAGEFASGKINTDMGDSMEIH
jgi:hypothetical protein